MIIIAIIISIIISSSRSDCWRCTYVCWRARRLQNGGRCCVYSASSQTSTCHWHRDTPAQPGVDAGSTAFVSTADSTRHAPSRHTPEHYPLEGRTSSTASACDTTARTCRPCLPQSPLDPRPSSYEHTHKLVSKCRHKAQPLSSAWGDRSVDYAYLSPKGVRRGRFIARLELADSVKVQNSGMNTHSITPRQFTCRYRLN